MGFTELWASKRPGQPIRTLSRGTNSTRNGRRFSLRSAQTLDATPNLPLEWGCADIPPSRQGCVTSTPSVWGCRGAPQGPAGSEAGG